MTGFIDSPIGSVSGIGEKYSKVLAMQGIHTIYDLLIHFPEFYINKSVSDNKIEANRDKVYILEIKKINLYRNFKKRSSIINITAELGESKINLRFFNKPYLMNILDSGEKLTIYGKIKKNGQIFFIDNPKIINNEENDIIPVYRNISTIKPGIIKNSLKKILKELNTEDEILPEFSLKKHSFVNLAKAAKRIHSPQPFDPDDVEKEKKRFIYTEYLLFQIVLRYIRKKLGRVKRDKKVNISPDPEKLVLERVGFELTPDQKKAVSEIISDLNSSYSMQRLLMGEVGSGKTIVSFLFLLLIIRNNYQGVFLAPTEILANQHYEKGKSFFKGLSTGILTGSTPPKDKKKILQKLQTGELDLVFGTHSLLRENVAFRNLSAIVIDEQQRFGVSQRASIFYKGKNIDLLVTTATPIPRTMLLSVYKDLQISRIRSLPAGRKKITTSIIDPRSREKFYIKMKEELKKKEKGYIILPLIENSSKFPGLRSIEDEMPFFLKTFDDIQTGIISGRTDPAEREKILKNFSSGKIRVLISTTVVEVGIDISDATFIVIEDADRYGLSQLHQLRGRIGRGEVRSNCYLFPSANITESGKKRLNSIKQTSDGFKIAEIDMEMRGGGQISGIEQSGYLDFKIGDIKKDLDLFKNAQADAIIILENTAHQTCYIKKIIEHTEEKIKSLSFS